MRQLACLTLLATLALGACAGGQEQQSPAVPGQTESVSIIDFAFDPATLTVGVGDTVEWTNDGAAPHTVTFDEGPDSGTLNPGGTFSHTFDSVGEFNYICTIHPQMTGIVSVGP